MKSCRGTSRLCVFIVGAALLLAFCTVSSAEQAIGMRVTFDSGGVKVKGPSDTDWSPVGANRILLAGDEIIAAQEGYLEIETETGIFLRMAGGSGVKVVSVTSSITFSATTGSFYLQRINRSSGDMSFVSPVCTINPQSGSTVRVDITPNGGTKVSVRWGQATVHSEGGPERSLEQWQRSFADPGYVPTAPAAFDPAEEDAFDSWNRTRARQLATGETATRLPVISHSTSSNGRWVDIDGGSYWSPGPYYFYGPDWYDWYGGYWGWHPGYGCIPAWYFASWYITGNCGHWYHHPDYGPVWGIGERRHLAWDGHGQWYGRNGDTGAPPHSSHADRLPSSRLLNTDRRTDRSTPVAPFGDRRSSGRLTAMPHGSGSLGDGLAGRGSTSHGANRSAGNISVGHGGSHGRR